MSKLAEAIANTVKAAQDQDWTKLGTSIVDIVESGVSAVSYTHLTLPTKRIV